MLFIPHSVVLYSFKSRGKCSFITVKACSSLLFDSGVGFFNYFFAQQNWRSRALSSVSTSCNFILLTVSASCSPFELSSSTIIVQPFETKGTETWKLCVLGWGCWYVFCSSKAKVLCYRFSYCSHLINTINELPWSLFIRWALSPFFSSTSYKRQENYCDFCVSYSLNSWCWQSRRQKSFFKLSECM